MELRTERLVLRPVTVEDLESTYSYAGNADNARYMMFLPYESLEEAEKAVRGSAAEWQKARPRWCDFSVILNGRHIGGVTLYMEGEPGEAELGWILHRDFWGRGYALEAARAVMEYARDVWGVRRVFACCDGENGASRRLMERLGMKKRSEGTRTNRSMPGQMRTELVYETDI